MYKSYKKFYSFISQNKLFQVSVATLIKITKLFYLSLLDLKVTGSKVIIMLWIVLLKYILTHIYFNYTHTYYIYIT